MKTEDGVIEKESVVVRFSGDSGDGMQLTGTQFTDTTAFLGKDISTFPEFPAEIRAPAGTIAGVSGFQVHFGSKEIYTAGDEYDVLVAMNAAALKSDIGNLKKGGIIITNTAGFDSKNLRLAEYPEGVNPLEDDSLSEYEVYKVNITSLTKEALKETGLSNKELERSKNMFVLGMLYWIFDQSPDYTINFINEKFSKSPELAKANILAIKSGINFGETTEIFNTRFKINASPQPPGTYRSITGNNAIAIALISASEISGLPLFLGSYPITPASDILHELSKYKHSGVRTFQAEDEIAAICSAIGASYGGSLSVTTTSGPGMSLKTEALGLATILELPLVVINIQRGGPSTGLPTKTEQSDLLQAMYGRHGECPLPILAPCSPSDCFETVYEACKLTVEHMTPVIVLSDGYIANGSEPWKFPTAKDLPKIKSEFTDKPNSNDGTFLPYKRDENFVRPRVKPGTKGLEHRIGGLEKANETGDISYEPHNHELMVNLRQAKVDKIADSIPEIKIDTGSEDSDLLVLGWGSTYGSIKTAVLELINEGYNISHIHLRHMNPFPKNLGMLLMKFKNILIPEINNGQLIKIIRDKYLVPAIGLNKIQGLPFTTSEIKNKILEILNKK
ncbi:MAG TPA: 2-oxoacid:acceptor oxidoreductase subunit alpha [Ignavibacteria bacterium]|nr:2-oxoglutarate ferredoxin oxidoreductase subunit alpha [Bacteroidota bacterium]HRI85021.1 2-oxoacid:acceptor oxidoreductase subunit alpha [Ignavibacteria bacterium]HRJ98215.1 2-oxoacid:acceptor oxidoreductase subunit alpha [Ignavibacteria bacterium]